MDDLIVILNRELARLLMYQEGHVKSNEDGPKEAWADFIVAAEDVLNDGRGLFRSEDYATGNKDILANAVLAQVTKEVAYARHVYIPRVHFERRISDARRKHLAAPGGRSLLQLPGWWSSTEDHEPDDDLSPAAGQVQAREAVAWEEGETTSATRLCIPTEVPCEAEAEEEVDAALVRINPQDHRIAVPRQQFFRIWKECRRLHKSNYGFADGLCGLFTQGVSNGSVKTKALQKLCRDVYDQLPKQRRKLHTTEGSGPEEFLTSYLRLSATPLEERLQVPQRILNLYAQLREEEPTLPSIERGSDAGEALARYLGLSGALPEERRQATRTKFPTVEVHFSRLAGGNSRLRRLVIAHHMGLTAAEIGSKFYGQPVNCGGRSVYPVFEEDLDELVNQLNPQPGHRYMIGEVDVARRMGRWTPAAFGR